ncbi:MAG: hypothetical protein JNK48_18645 [Bryobacterales bacterium]|nr:hypothetical protein [Bryobacterales bacterium]
MRNTLLLTVAALLTFQSLSAQSLVRPEQSRKRSVWWKVSTVALAVATSVDAHSSWGRIEANPVLSGANGRFGAKGIALKALITGGVLSAQYMMMKNHPKAEKYGAWTNFALAGALGSAAAYNYRLHRQPAAVSPILSTVPKQ